MLSQIERLSREVDGRYASDAELTFAIDYVRSFNLRVQTYQKLQEIESMLVQQTYSKMRTLDPTVFDSAGTDISAKWKRDTLRVLRYVAIAVLMDDADTFRERLLLWFQTIMRAFSAQRSCNLTYQVMQDVIKQSLTAPQANLVCPLLELSRRTLGTIA
ncbi:MAG: phycobilisome protein [Pegethrix bostrychoides GSE-TBD4-15B]|jgi:ABC-type multidrug transport system fused ATPase/permease subunit|uniref:Phycobilisome protein n=1 Tax=Pegethrix bostrychoides GSE-TBD4-15B TaxID=2839662 RepID=A0A951PF93_9CYAN|nr:phycobilisome protein [Pegethrix bostrychoides GSE-TBD4-15B]